MRETDIAQPRFFSSIDVGRRMGVGADRVRQLAREGRLKPAFVLAGGQRLFAAADVERFVADRDAHHNCGGR